MKAVFIILVSASLATASLPLENPLNLWLYHSEATGNLLTGEFPDQHTVSVEPGSRTIWLWRLIQDRSNVPSTGNGIFGWRSTVAGQAGSSNSEFISSGEMAFEVFARPLNWFSISQRTSFWTGSDGNPPDGFSQFHYGLEHGRHLYVDWGFVQAETGPLQAAMGRIPVRWGPGRFTQLMISGQAPAMDMIKIDLDLGDRVHFTGFTTTINSDSSTWLSAHRLDIKPYDLLRIGLSESILYTADGIDLAYANLFIPWYPVQWNERVDDNAFMCIDATWQPVRGIALYGEFLIDDIQYENIHDVPNKLGYTFGADFFSPETGLGAVAEYTAVQRYVYSQRKINNFYMHDARIIGSQLGPDADRITGSISYIGFHGITAQLKGSYTRHGEGNVYEGWPDSVQAGGAFPSGIIENTTELSLDLGWYPNNWLEVRTSGGVSFTGNTDNQSSVESDDSRVSVELILLKEN
ncbi:MAG: hypothetical protein KAH31_01155 [Candidatus Sabulitectum sp.]|nr:hypothetical protein [Candidatus Sabulitectum sp.]